MESSNFVMALITTFIGAAILLGVGVQVLASVQTSTNCSTLPGNAGTHQTTTNATGWALTCLNNNTTIQNGYALLLVIMIVIAAVAILAVVRLL